MEQKMITIPFDIELAKKIQEGEYPGKIVTRDGKDVRIVCFDAFNAYSLVVLIRDKSSEYPGMYNEVGQMSWSDESEQKSDLVLQVPEWTQYKDGDILACEVGNGDDDCYKWFSILNGNIGFMLGTIYFNSYVSYDYETSYKEELTYGENCNNIGSIRLATKEEKQRFIKRLKVEDTSKAKEVLKRFFGIEEKKEYKFEPFQKVLVRMHDGAVWEASLFSHLTNKVDEPFASVGGIEYEQCIPYNDQTKHLLGTADDWIATDEWEE